MALSASWTSFLKSIASYNGDLSSLTAPPFILSPTSLVEYSQYWGEHPDLLLEPNFYQSGDGKDGQDAMAVKRIIAVTKWFISTLRSQYCSRNESMGSEKKPLNPFLGELFVGKWPDLSKDQKLGETVLLSEQVSHHPPVTAYAILNEKNNMTLQGYNGIKATISATLINVKQYGHAILEYKDLNETYLITLPPLHIEGLIVASPFVELEGTSYIQSSSGYLAVIDYAGRGYFSGKKNTFKARIYKDKFASAHKENALVTMSGQWSGKSYIGKGSRTPSSSGELFYDAAEKTPEHLVVKPIEEQHALESRKAWEKVAIATRSGDYDLISKEKSLIENKQREMRKLEREAGSLWNVRWFDLVDFNGENGTAGSDPLVSLANVASLSIGNVPLGSAKGCKREGESKLHWRFARDRWEDEKEVKI
ncbi:Oxysterol-binding protein [Metschnikowia bicuspidata var. bicuspidata NRRL YB-4993]|uniref:Oxysterol-binding protein n=1 Tax=Metschnikowia bicuspidata var. bicuspidata NRRL YB-4993 TaxID=869754 RepID=A0A1A0HDG8_9ASCO|nr:Oxysterol-binding protein [Metschnikowia bicuspidata var. bicuspidata NRRL YB-4993]OBA21973.1 Oxysterol-binding protein [Metschnikowia bicuspidata var. bicuspidata NRRL YB-4993]